MPWTDSALVVGGPKFGAPYGYSYDRPYKSRRSAKGTGRARTYRAGSFANTHSRKSMRKRRGY